MRLTNPFGGVGSAGGKHLLETPQRDPARAVSRAPHLAGLPSGSRLTLA